MLFSKLQPIKFRKSVFDTKSFARDLFSNRSLIWELTKRDLSTRFAGSSLGVFWIFIQPVVTIVILWFVFEVGFKAMPKEHFPFILWLSSGMVPWFFFAEAIGTATNSISQYSYLLKNIAINVSILPLTKILSAFLVHIFFMVILFLMFAVYGHYPDIFSIQLLYYAFAMVVLIMGLSLISSAAVLFFKDLGQFIQTILQFLFWASPIFWSLDMFPKKYHTVLQLNPLYYLANGYRECLVNKIWFWEEPKLLFYFWFVALTILFLGSAFFKRLKPHFGDVV